MYNQTRMNGQPMPLLMGFTKPSKIQTVENETPVMYDPMKQIVAFDMRVVGTKSLKTSMTLKRGTASCGCREVDKKNEIDDQKNVK